MQPISSESVYDRTSGTKFGSKPRHHTKERSMYQNGDLSDLIFRRAKESAWPNWHCGNVRSSQAVAIRQPKKNSTLEAAEPQTCM